MLSKIASVIRSWSCGTEMPRRNSRASFDAITGSRAAPPRRHRRYRFSSPGTSRVSNFSPYRPVAPEAQWGTGRACPNLRAARRDLGCLGRVRRCSASRLRDATRLKVERGQLRSSSAACLDPLVADRHGDGKALIGSPAISRRRVGTIVDQGTIERLSSASFE